MFTPIEMNFYKSEYEAITFILSSLRESVGMHVFAQNYDCVCVYVCICICDIFMSTYS